MSSNGVVRVFPSSNEFIGEFTAPDIENEAELSKQCQTIIILDRSGSMESHLIRMTNRILPLFFSKLSYRKLNQIFLLTFSQNAELLSRFVSEFPSMQMIAGGTTYMKDAIQNCKDVFEDLDSDKPVRVLAISDGLIFDQKETAAAADSLKQFLDNKHFYINSKAVRLFTSSDEPDTTALCSLLQINNAIPKSLLDVDAVNQTDDDIATQMAELFMGDNFLKTKILSTTEKILRRKPWNDSTSKLLFPPGINNFWMSKVPENGFCFNDEPMRVSMQSPITVEHHEAILRSQSPLIAELMRVLKVADSIESNKTLEHMNQYLTNRNSTLASTVKKIIDDEKVAGMTPSEKALYIAGEETSAEGEVKN